MFADDWIRTMDLWHRNQPLYQMSHNHCPNFHYFQTRTEEHHSTVLNCNYYYNCTQSMHVEFGPYRFPLFSVKTKTAWALKPK